MEHKLPVVATDEGGIPDVVKDGENGLISEKRNPMSLANCISKLLENKKLREKWVRQVIVSLRLSLR